MSSQPLFSAQWHRVRDVCPRLAGDVSVSRHVYRGRTAYILHRRATTAFHRLDMPSFTLIDRLDGVISVGELWEQAIIERGEDAPTQDEWIGLLADLHAAELIVVDRRVPEERLFDQRQRHQATERQQRYLNPLYLRFPLHDPDLWLNDLEKFAKQIFSRRVAIAWVGLVISACLIIVIQGEHLWRDVSGGSFLNARNTVIFILVYPPLKLLHELAHALAVKRVGGEVHEAGVALMVFLPLPYVDASASALFADKYDRMLVSAAGIIVELAFAAIGLLLWAFTGGVIQDIGLVLFVIGSISSLLLNGNPLLKFDGYYLLVDWIEIPNLAARSRQMLLETLRKMVSGESSTLGNQVDRSEKLWLQAYGITSPIYRTVLMLSIAWMLSDRWYFIGVLFALFAVVFAVVLPAWRAVSSLMTNPVYRNARATSVVGTTLVLLVVLLCWLPLPQSSVIPGVVWVPEEAIIRVQSECEIEKVYNPPGAQVNVGDSLFTCRDNESAAQLDELVARVDELSVRRASAAARDQLVLHTLEAKLAASQVALSNVRLRIDEEHQRANIDGRFDIVGTSSLQGRALKRGDIVGYVIPPEARTVRVAVDERLITHVNQHLESVSLRVNGGDGQAHVFQTHVVKRTPKSTRVVASPALSTLGGGTFEADPGGDGRLLTEAVFDVELHWPETAGFSAVGSHVGVRLNFSPTTILARLTRVFKQSLADRVPT